MVYAIDSFELDPVRFELRRAGQRIACEPQVFKLLLLLVENADRMVPRDEIVDVVWDGRIISETALSSRIKSARRALGDDGASQHMIRTVHGQGFRFVGQVVRRDVEAQALATCAPAREASETGPVHGRPAIAVLPFEVADRAAPYAGWARAIPHDLIAELSRLHWLIVIARGSSFRFISNAADVRNVGAQLGVRYCLTGTLQSLSGRIELTIELADTRDAGIVWSEHYSGRPDEIHELRSRIVAGALASLEVRIPAHEADLSRLQDPEHLSAWTAYHLGLQHMFRFNRDDNALAMGLFSRAVEIDPGFARAHGGLSFSHFQNAFLRYGGNPDDEIGKAVHCAEQALLLDPLDPFAYLNMGRAHWLDGEVETSIGWLDRSIELNPNYAQAIYSRAWSRMIIGDSIVSRRDVDDAITLSPIDPLRYAMSATRALSHLMEANYPLAAQWAEQAARAPGAHHLICLIAVACHHMNGDEAAAGRWAEVTRRRTEHLSREDFLRSFPFADAGIRGRMTGALQAHGF